MIVLQLILFCVLFTLMVKLAVRDDALNALYFYPKSVQERVCQLGLTGRDAVARKRKLFMVSFFLVMLVALLLIIGAWNGIHTFWPAYGQALLFLEVMVAVNAVLQRFGRYADLLSQLGDAVRDPGIAIVIQILLGKAVSLISSPASLRGSYTPAGHRYPQQFWNQSP